MAQTHLSVDALAQGDVVCTIGSGNGFTIVSKATPSTLASFGRAYGIATSASSAGAVAAIQTLGAIPAAITGLAASASFVRVSTSARCELVSVYSTGDYPLGSTDSSGLLTLLPLSVTPAPTGNVDTRAALQAVLTPPNARVITVAEVSAAYKFDTSSSATADGWTILTANDATPGRWLLQGAQLKLPARGGGLDDSANMLAVFAAVSGKSIEVVLSDPLYTIANPIQLTYAHSNVDVRLGNGTVIKSTMTVIGIAHTIWYARMPDATGTTTLSASNTPGSKTIQTVALIPDGTTLRLTNSSGTSTMHEYAIAVSHTGSGPYTTTLDRVIEHQFVGGEIIEKVATGTRIEKFRLRGNGIITGTGDRAWDFQGAVNCSLEDVQIDTSQGTLSDAACSWDLGCEDCFGKNVKVLGPIPFGLLKECAKRCQWIACKVTGTASGAFAMWNCMRCGDIDCHGDDNVGNGRADGNDGDGEGNLGCSVIGGSYDGNGSANISLDHCFGHQLIGVNACYSKNAANGNVSITNTCADTQIIGGHYDGGANVGLLSNGVRTIVSGGATFDGNANAGGNPMSEWGGGVAPIFQQRGDLLSVSTTGGTTTLSLRQSLASVIETGGSLGSNAIVQVPNIQGLTYDLFNGNSGAFTTTFRCAGGDGGFTLKQSTRVRAYVNSTGNLTQMPKPSEFTSITLSSGSQTIAMTGFDRVFLTGAGGGSTITNITGTPDGALITLVNVSANNVTFTRANAVLRGSADKVLPQFGTLQVILKSGLWYEVGDQLTNG